MASFQCKKCGKVLDEGQYYLHKNGTRMDLCKKCLTMHVDNFDESTYLWLLEKIDVPYIPSEWYTLRERAYARDPEKVTGMTVFGKYLSKMRLKRWKDYGWADTERLQEQELERLHGTPIAESEDIEADLKEKYAAGEISEAEYKTLMPTQGWVATEAEKAPPPPVVGEDNFFNEKEFFPADELPDLAAELTHDDKVYLAMKWGRMYRPVEWVELERTYTEMTDSFAIEDADTKNTLILLCKTTLKANQCLDSGDLEGFQKLSRVQESLRKSAKFTAAQNKEKKGNVLDSVGQLVQMCEHEGFIPRFCTDIPQDKVDVTLKDMKEYTRKLVTQDLGFGQQIEQVLKKIQLQKEMEEQADKNEPEHLSTEDYENYFNEIENQKAHDLEIYNEEEEVEES